MQRLTYICSIQPSMSSSAIDARYLGSQIIAIFLVVYNVLEWYVKYWLLFGGGFELKVIQ